MTAGRERLTKAQDSGHVRFLGRFVERGWIHGIRENSDEQAAVDFGLRKRWLRRELSEVHFTPKGRLALKDTPDE